MKFNIVNVADTCFRIEETTGETWYLNKRWEWVKVSEKSPSIEMLNETPEHKETKN